MAVKMYVVVVVAKVFVVCLEFNIGRQAHPCKWHLLLQINFNSLVYDCLQCFDTVGWAAGRASGL